MKKPTLLLHKGNEFQSSGMGKFAKDVLHVGRWIHPITGQEVVVDRARLQRLAANTEKYRGRQDRQSLSFPDGHTTEADKNLGWWNGPFTVIGDTLYGFVEPTAAGVAEKLADRSIRSVSPMIEFDRLDQKGERYDEVITHVCATPVPVTDGQQDFVKLSQDEATGVFYIPEELAGTLPEGNRNRTEGRMDLKKLAKALGLPEDTAADKILEAAEKAGQAATKLSAAESQQTALAAELKAQGLELKDGKVVKLSNDTTPKPEDSPEVADLKRRLAAQEDQGRKGFVEKASQLAAEHVRDGRVPAALQGDVTELLSIQSEVQALSLDQSGKAVGKAVNLFDRLQKVLKGLPSIKSEGLSQHGGDVSADERKKLDAKANEIVARMQPELAKK